LKALTVKLRPACPAVGRFPVYLMEVEDKLDLLLEMLEITPFGV
jgi:hypothetical protein